MFLGVQRMQIMTSKQTYAHRTVQEKSLRVRARLVA
jgi:hypothetical protein